MCLRFIFTYFKAIEERMGKDWFLGAYVIGAIADNQGSRYSTAEVLFYFKMGSESERKYFNTDEGGLSKRGRVNHSFNEHYVDVCQYPADNPNRITINYSICYKDVAFDKIMFVPKAMSEKIFNFKIQHALSLEDIEAILAISS